MSRSTWKEPFSQIPNFKEGVHIWSRGSMILPEHVGTRVGVHNGNRFVAFKISAPMTGHKFGEFAQTRKRPVHKKKKR